jgi:hypothetical protein
LHPAVFPSSGRFDRAFNLTQGVCDRGTLDKVCRSPSPRIRKMRRVVFLT